MDLRDDEIYGESNLVTFGDAQGAISTSGGSNKRDRGVAARYYTGTAAFGVTH